MKPSPVRFRPGRLLGTATSLALLGAMAGCHGVGEIGGGGKAGTGSATTGGAGPGGGNPTGTAGTGAVTPIDPGKVAPPSSGWYDALKASDCAAAPTALPSSRIWRLSDVQWKNTVVAALGVSAP